VNLILISLIVRIGVGSRCRIEKKEEKEREHKPEGTRGCTRPEVFGKHAMNISRTISCNRWCCWRTNTTKAYTLSCLATPDVVRAARGNPILCRCLFANMITARGKYYCAAASSPTSLERIHDPDLNQSAERDTYSSVLPLGSSKQCVGLRISFRYYISLRQEGNQYCAAASSPTWLRQKENNTVQLPFRQHHKREKIFVRFECRIILQ